MAINVDTFKMAAIDGFARPNLFKVTIHSPFLSFFGESAPGTGAKPPPGVLPFVCRAASVPPSTTGIIELPYQGRKIKIAGDRTYAEWVITIMNNESYDLRERFERWSDAINAHELNVRDAQYYNITSGAGAEGTYKWDGEIYHTDKSGNVISAYKMVGCFPSEISAMDMAWDTNDTIQEFTVTLQYDYVIPLTNNSIIAKNAVAAKGEQI